MRLCPGSGLRACGVCNMYGIFALGRKSGSRPGSVDKGSNISPPQGCTSTVSHAAASQPVVIKSQGDRRRTGQAHCRPVVGQQLFLPGGRAGVLERGGGQAGGRLGVDSQVCLCEGVASITWVESNGGSGPLIEEGRPMWCEDTAMQCNVRPCKACCKRTNSCTEPGRRLVTKVTKQLLQPSQRCPRRRPQLGRVVACPSQL